jgi:hypothetical protein
VQPEGGFAGLGMSPMGTVFSRATSTLTLGTAAATNALEHESDIAKADMQKI